jgi:hypothetical protein
MPFETLENPLMAVAETAMGTPVHAQEGGDAKYVTAVYE